MPQHAVSSVDLIDTIDRPTSRHQCGSRGEFVLRHSMPSIKVNGIDVDFPFDPYPSQIRYMSSVIDALRGGQSALLESPTGTGKTLCLLCATLAWRATYIAALQARAHGALNTELAELAGVPETGDGGAFAALAALLKPDGKGAAALRAPKVIYASRTHAQLGQAVRELRRTSYRPGVVQLASRDQLCIHRIRKRLSGARLNAACRALTAPRRRGCKFHHPVASVRPTENKAEELVKNMHEQPPLDIEELRVFGEGIGACPWFLSRAATMAESCDILFIPYNYLMDRHIRQSLDVDWANDVLIVDEAHNMPDVCSNAMSFELSRRVRDGCIRELDACIKRGLNPLGIKIPALEELAKTEEGLDKVLGSENRDMLEFRILRSVLCNMEKFVQEVVFPPRDGGDTDYKVFEPDTLRKLFKDVDGPTEETWELFVELLDRAMQVGAKNDEEKQDEDAEDGEEERRGNNPLQILQSAIRVLFSTAKEGHPDSFRLVVHTSNEERHGRSLCYWCFDPSIAMNDLLKLGVRCVLCTSGTLAPLSTFASELGASFPVRLENPHVVPTQQVLAGIVSAGPCKTGLSSAYRKRGEKTEMGLGRALLQIIDSVPDGVLVFFPSYSVMEKCVETWKRLGPTGSRPSLWEHMCRRKRMVVEQRASQSLAAAMELHRANVDAGDGSMMLAVCRGKVSEGIDFSDEYGRAVIVTGLPYPSAFDPKIKLKRELCDRKRQRQMEGGHTGLNWGATPTGSEWYMVEATVAVNQAVGRAIRHRNDFGVVLLCDERFEGGGVRNKISKWLRPQLKVWKEFDGLPKTIDDFFNHVKTLPCAKHTKKSNLSKAVLDIVNRTENVEVKSQQADSGQVRTIELKDDEVLDKIEEYSQIPAAQLKKRSRAAAKIGEPSITQRFLASQPVVPESSKVSQPVAKRPRSSKPAPLSKRARAAFKGKDEVRQFISLFKRILAAGKTVAEGEGPLLRKAEADGVVAAGEVVKFTRANADAQQCEPLLREIRAHVPVRFRGAFDMALREK